MSVCRYGIYLRVLDLPLVADQTEHSKINSYLRATMYYSLYLQRFVTIEVTLLYIQTSCFLLVDTHQLILNVQKP